MVQLSLENTVIDCSRCLAKFCALLLLLRSSLGHNFSRSGTWNWYTAYSKDNGGSRYSQMQCMDVCHSIYNSEYGIL
jgi:hypothetical protein